MGAADEIYTKRPLPKILCVVQWSEKNSVKWLQSGKKWRI